ncbi:MAG TPA: hypothetical protein VFA19_02930 [Gaiellaceae bacterium]|nr:hypothetical protein [Gaiellaceae bacterium]
MTGIAATEVHIRPWFDDRAAIVDGRTGENWGFLPALSLVAAGGVLLLAFADNAARGHQRHATGLYWIAIVAIVVPIAARLTRRTCSHAERIGLLLVVGVASYLLKLMTWPLGFAFHDDLGQLRTTLDIDASHHLFSTNPIVPAYSYYPGLEEVSNAVASLSGVSPTAAGFLVVGAARIVLVIALFRMFEVASASSRVAGIATLLYAANPNFVYFDGQVAYESLALPLAVATLCCVALRAAGSTSDEPSTRETPRGSALVACILVGGTVVSHHISAYFLTAFLAAWVLAGQSKRFSGTPRGSLVLATVSLITTTGWLLFAGSATERELGTIPGAAASSIWDLIFGNAPPRQLFHAANGTPEPLLTRWIGYASVVLILTLLPFGLRRTLRRGNAVSIVLLGLALLYPPSLVLRLTTAGTETSSRASEFVFIGVGYVVALALVGSPSSEANSNGFLGLSRLVTPAFSVYAGIVFAGGLIIGWSPSARLPGPFEVGDPPRSISPEGVAAAKWMSSSLGTNNILLADSTNALLMASYGRQAPIETPIAALPPLKLFRDRTLTRLDREALNEVDYLVTDERLTKALPLNGGYFGPDDYKLGLTRPLPPFGLRKFDQTPELARVYDSGNIAIYRTGRT